MHTCVCTTLMCAPVVVGLSRANPTERCFVIRVKSYDTTAASNQSFVHVPKYFLFLSCVAG